LGDWQPYIFRTENYGTSWSKITEGIPDDFPVRVVREDPNREGLLYAGTEYGMFISKNDGKTWSPFQFNLPVTPITDIKIHKKDLVLSTMGRGFWILDNLSPLHQSFSSSVVSLLKIEDTYRTPRIWGEIENVTYSSSGTDIHYYLPDSLAENIQLKILSENNIVIRTFINLQEKQNKKDKGEQNINTGFSSGVNSSSLKKSEGLHRFKWDLHHKGSWDKRTKMNEKNGPLVSPGIYKAQLIINKMVFEQSFSVLMDPRLEQAGTCLDDLIAQEKLALEIRDLQSEAKQTAEKIEVKLAEMDKLSNRKKKKRKEYYAKLNALKAQFVTQEGRYQQPMLLSQISYLSSMINQADQNPGIDAYERFEELKTKFENLKKEVADIS
jgi:hypothetical protein